MKKVIRLSLILLFFSFAFVLGQENIDVKPGVDRWSIKTSSKLTGKIKKVSLSTLLLLPLLDKQYTDKTYPDKLIPVSPGDNLKEGDLIETEGYLHLVALERDATTKKDGDYHIQLTLHPDWSDSCFIVEIPYPDFVSAAGLKDSCNNNRAWIRDNLLKGNKNPEPATSGSVMKHPVYVRVTGQLFYDAIHAEEMRGPNPTYRGKHGTEKTPMHSYTAWEIHPVIHIEFAKAK